MIHKRLVLFAIALVMMLGLTSPLLASQLPFDDVSTSSWYYSDIQKAYDSGLIYGQSAPLVDKTLGV